MDRRGVGAVLGGLVLGAVNGRSVTSLAGSADAMVALKPGSHVPVTVERSGNRMTLAVTLDQLPAS